jgi:serine/threonine protein kinase
VLTYLRNKQLTDSKAVVIAHDSLCHLHNHRIAHRDLQPDNLLFRIPYNTLCFIFSWNGDYIDDFTEIKM